MPERTVKDELTELLANLDSSNADMVADAIEALIHEKIAEAFNLMSKKIEDDGLPTPGSRQSAKLTG
jgi:hypothetical protein